MKTRVKSPNGIYFSWGHFLYVLKYRLSYCIFFESFGVTDGGNNHCRRHIQDLHTKFLKKGKRVHLPFKVNIAMYSCDPNGHISARNSGEIVALCIFILKTSCLPLRDVRNSQMVRTDGIINHQFPSRKITEYKCVASWTRRCG